MIRKVSIRWISIVVILHALLLPTTIISQHHPDRELDSLLMNCIENLALQNYDASERTIKKIMQSYPELPLGETYTAALHIVKKNDVFARIDFDYLDSLFDAANEKISRLENQVDEFWMNYFSALNFGYKAYANALVQNYFTAFTNGFESLEHFDNCLQIDSTCNDAKIAIGSYIYWKNNKSRFFDWLPFVEDNSKEGIELIEKSLDGFAYNKDLARVSLVWIYIEEKQFQKAINLAENTLSLYPNSRVFLWALARAYQDVDIIQAINVYDRIIESIGCKKEGWQENYIVASHKKLQLLERANRNKEIEKLTLQIKEIFLDYVSNNSDVNRRLELMLDKSG